MRNAGFGLMIGVALLCSFSHTVNAGEGPYFVTYTQQLEEPGNLEVENQALFSRPTGASRFWDSSTEFEYGVTGWWTAEVYLDTQFTANQGGLFAGDRFENRFRFTRREHWINPILYAEFENTNEADKSLLEVVGHDGEADLAAPNSEARHLYDHEAELKLLLGSQVRGWNISENFITEKNLGHAPWEFGYSVGVSRPLSLVATPRSCNWCRENFQLGMEAYGGLGDTDSFNLRDTSHYIAPVVAWMLADGVRLKASPGFGLTDSSLPFSLRLAVSYEIPQFGRAFRR